ncbi:MYND domain protein [Rutstroemia sp. NJR-2017a BBW]|nr:MYND domain protein [Rutstroemia sp. NJR-2017a BBW]
MAGREPWYDIFKMVEKSDITEHYKDNLMPMKLRGLAEKIYGEGVFGVGGWVQSFF